MVNGVSVTPGGQRAVTASHDCTLKVWDLESGTMVATFAPDGSALACAVAPNGRTIVGGGSLSRVHFLCLENA